MLKGVEINGKAIKFLDLQGKDPREDIHRWRIYGYYAPYLAETLFFDSKDKYLQFINDNRQNCYINEWELYKDSTDYKNSSEV